MMRRSESPGSVPVFVRGACRAFGAAVFGLGLASAGAEAQEQSSDEASALQEVTVTGSRIVRRDLDAASPIVTVEEQAFNESSTLGVESILNELPQFVPAGTQFVTGDVFPTATNTPGASTLNLRGLGTNRTLVLIDGRRGQPANSTLVIDVNSIPSSAIESVEIISGGASAVYGADAMGGVTNFKLRDDFQGAELEMRTGVTERGDGEESRLSALFGANVDEGRGNVMLGVEWTRRSEATLFDRPFFEDSLTDPGAPGSSIRLDVPAYEPNSAAGGLPSQAAVNALYPERTAGSNVNRSTQFYFNTDNSLFKDVGALGFNGEYGQLYKMQPNGVLGQNFLTGRLSSPLERYSIFGRGEYALSDSVNAYAQTSFVTTETRSASQPSRAIGGFGLSIPRGPDHPEPAELTALLDSRGANVYSTTQFDPTTGLPVITAGIDANWRLGLPLDFLPARQLENSTELYQILAGLEGDLGLGDWTWEVYTSHGATKTDSLYVGHYSLERLRLIAEAPNFGRGFTQSGAGQTTLTCTSGLPVFEQFQISQDCIDAITLDATDRQRLTQDIVEANLQGGVLDLPAGELRAAAGLSYRKNEFEFTPDPVRETNNVIDIPVGVFANARVQGETEVKEAYAELLVPLLRDKPLVRTLELELGGRYSDYDTAGGVPTYKALFSWSPIDMLRVRGGYQLANRAPNINELFLGASSVPVITRGPDPCRTDTRDANGNLASNPDRAQVQALCSALIGSGTSVFDADPNNFTGDGRTDGGEIEVRSGNVDLESEEGKTYTLGLVLSSPFEHPAARSITLAVDYYEAKITDAIAQVSAQTTYDLCFNRDGQSNPTYSLDDPNGMCSRIVRDEVTGNRQFVNTPYANLGALETSGIDLQVNWRTALADIGLERLPGNVSLNLSVNKLLSFKSQEFPTQPSVENAGTLARGGQFDYRAVTTLRYSAGDGQIALNWRRLPAVRAAAYVTDPETLTYGADSYSIYNLSGGWRFSDSVALTGGIDNLFDRDPNRVGANPADNAAGNTLAGYYDVLGRRYYLSMKLDF